MKNIFDISNNVRNEYDSGVELCDGLNFIRKDVDKSILFITQSKFETGDKDEYGKDKPYYNITNYRLNVAIRATDFDTKDIQVQSETRDYVRSMLMNKRINQWMKQKNFSKTLNRFGERRPTSGWVMAKKVYDDDGEVDVKLLKPENVMFSVDAPLENPILELHPNFKRSELVEMKGTWDNDVIDLILETDEDSFDLEEITGIMPETVYEENGDKDIYNLYKCIIYNKGQDDKYVLYKEELDGKLDDYYRYCDWFAIEGRSGRGVVEDMFEAQWGTNETKLLQREAFMLASKTVFATNSEQLQNNIINDVDNGHIFKLGDNESFNQVNTMTNALPAFSELINDWDEQAQNVTSTFDALTGETLPSGTPFRSVAIQNKEASSMFILRREEGGIFWEGIFNDWIIPDILKDIDREWILSAEFSAGELAKIDERFGIYTANDVVKERLLALELGPDFTAETYEQSILAYKDFLGETDDVRFLQVPKDYFKDFEFKIRVMITNESQNKAAALESISNIIAQVSNTFNPQTGSFAMLDNPALSQLFSKAVELAGAGISPVTLNKLQAGSAPSRKLESKPVVEEQESIAADTALEQEGV